tara:strand:+ start:147 stop:401 length:255 start_codon:yes stop_codon:yes gene_type:complete
MSILKRTLIINKMEIDSILTHNDEWIIKKGENFEYPKGVSSESYVDDIEIVDGLVYVTGLDYCNNKIVAFTNLGMKKIVFNNGK